MTDQPVEPLSAKWTRAALDTLGPVTFGPGCAPFDHPLTCQCPYPVAAAERDRLRALTPEATAPDARE